MTDQPTYAQISLPPGLTLEQFYESQKRANAVSMTVITALAIAAWDYMYLFPQEVAVYRHFVKQRTFLSSASWAFIVLRYSIFVTLISGLWFTSLQNQHCQVAASLSQAGFVTTTASVGIIFRSRVVSIWKEYNKKVVGIVSISLFIMVACWTAVVTQLRAHEGPPTVIGSNCQLSNYPAWSPINYVSSVAFDVCILYFSLIWMKVHAVGSPLRKQFLSDNIIYFIVVGLSNVVLLIIQCLGSKHWFLKTLALPWPTLLNTAMGSRAYLNLKLYDDSHKHCEVIAVSCIRFETNPARAAEAAVSLELIERSDDTIVASPGISTSTIVEPDPNEDPVRYSFHSAAV